MRKPLPMRRLVGGMNCILLAALILFARLIAPAMAMPAPATAADAVALAGLHIICHADGPEDPANEPPAHGSGQDGCLFCPACHLATQAALPAPAGATLRPPIVMRAGFAVPLPPATGPPDRTRATAQPTGPPSLSA